ncbi:MAG: class I SAM-dependent methyltransferase [Methanobacteriota archaeon]|nr:MAG: class I SAM-dependent methyltransferase [Euryarchaeota archaeon]
MYEFLLKLNISRQQSFLMLIEVKPPQPCHYCRRISKYEKDYKIQQGIYSAEETIWRCEMHFQFSCGHCGDKIHFTGMTWCDETNNFLCFRCGKRSFVFSKFWDKTYYFLLDCPFCGKKHKDLLFKEFQGTHPFQSDKMRNVWRPKGKQIASSITIDEFLQFENQVIKYRKDLSLIGIHSDFLDEDNVDNQDSKKHWEETAENWIKVLKTQGENGDEGDRNRQWIIDPCLWEMIGIVKDKMVLDAGCGNGYLTRKLARKGAIAFGIDYSQKFIDYCLQREKEEPSGCKFFQGDLADLHMFEDHTFDLVVSNIVMIDVKDYKNAFNEIHRVLKPTGKFIWSNTHPVFGRLGAVDFRVPFDIVRKEERMGKIIDRYFDGGAMLISWGNIKPIWQFERTLEDYSKGLKESGFAITEIREPRPSKEIIARHPELAFDAERYPHFIIYECVPFKQK